MHGRRWAGPAFIGAPVSSRDGGRPSTVNSVEVVVVRDGSEVSIGLARPRSPCPLELVDDLARFQLAARRLGWSLRLRAPDPELAELLVLVGLDPVLPTDP